MQKEADSRRTWTSQPFPCGTNMSSQIMEYNPALDVFGKRKIDSSVDSITYAEIKCQQAIDQKGPYIFRNDGCQHPILLRDVMLKMKCKLVKATAGAAIAAAEPCGTVN